MTSITTLLIKLKVRGPTLCRMCIPSADMATLDGSMVTLMIRDVAMVTEGSSAHVQPASGRGLL